MEFGIKPPKRVQREKISVTLNASTHQDLTMYVEGLRAQDGDSEINLSDVIDLMLAKVLAGDRGFQEYKKKLSKQKPPAPVLDNPVHSNGFDRADDQF